MKNKIHLIRYLILLISIINVNKIFAQIIDNQQAHFSTKWEQINMQNFRLIFPKEFRESASLLATRIDSMIILSSKDLDRKSRNIPIILQENHIEQNGFAQLAPRKIEAFSTPGPASNNQEWLPNLILHEARHIAQMDNLTGYFHKPFWEQLAFALYAIHLPAWYFEGDAVSFETQFSNGGRGRTPSFFMPLRTNELSNKHYSFDKNILGSYKDITPSHYVTGYLMNTYLTNEFGYQVKGKLLKEMRTNLLRTFNFQKALKTQTKKRSMALYEAMISEQNKQWPTRKSNRILTEIHPNKNKYYSHYYLPQSNDSESIFTLYSSPQTVQEFRKIDNGKEKTLLKIGYQLTPYFHQSGEFIVWDEIRKNGRFGKETYNIIRLLNLKTNEIKTLSRKSRFYSPIIDAKNKIVYTVQVDKNNCSSLISIDLNSGNQREIIKMPNGIHIQQPSINPDKTKIIAIAISEKGTTLLELDLNSKSTNQILPWSNQQFQHPVYYNDGIIFKAHFNGIDNIYKYSGSQNKLYQLTDSRFGAFYPSIDDHNIMLYNEYQSDGYRLAKLDLSSIIALEITPNFQADAISDKQITSQFSNSLTDTTSKFKTEKYNTLNDFFNFHSLSISANNFENFENYKPGIFWISNDLLNTSQLKIGYEYDMEIKKSTFLAEILYQKYYPKFSAKYQNRGRIGTAKSNKSDSPNVPFDYREHYYALDMQLPFSLYRGSTLYNFGFNFGTSYQKRYNLSIQTLKNFESEIILPLNYSLYFNRNTRRSIMDLSPRWGQNINITYRHLPFQSNSNGHMYALRTNFFFPGLFKNHSLQARFNYQNSAGRFENVYDIPMVSAFGYFSSNTVTNNLLLSYRLPLAYPDWTIGSISYIKRIHGLLFADYQNLHHSLLTPKTYGIGLTIDLNLFRYVLPDFSIGSKISVIDDSSAKNKIIPSFSFSYSY